MNFSHFSYLGELTCNEWFLLFLTEMKSNPADSEIAGLRELLSWVQFPLIKKSSLCPLSRLPSITQLVAVDSYYYEELVRTRQDESSLLSHSLKKSNLQVFNRNECTANYYNNNNCNIINNK